MSDTPDTSLPDVQAALRALPRVDDLLASAPVAEASLLVPHAAAVEGVRACLDDERARIRAGEQPRSRAALQDDAAGRVADAALPHLRCVVNATGVVVHTNLGRAPLSGAVAAHVADVSAHYSTLEFDVAKGARGSRHDHVADLLCRLTGAEDAAVVNNNAAAVMLVLWELARGHEAIVSRGELIEIGGSFRIPDIMELSGATMVEVGTTNKTHLADFERAMTPETSMAGSGPGEHTPGWSLAQGVDVVSCSGDKLLGAGQAGIILGRRDLIKRIKKNPLMRALRPDKMTLAALEGTLRSYLDAGEAWGAVPVLAMLSTDPAALHDRALALFGRVCARAGVAVPPVGEGGEARVRVGASELAVVPVASTPGGGSLPTVELPSWGLALTVDGVNPDELRARLVARRPRPVVARVADGALICDVRTLVDTRDENDLTCALSALM